MPSASSKWRGRLTINRNEIEQQLRRLQRLRELARQGATNPKPRTADVQAPVSRSTDVDEFTSGDSSTALGLGHGAETSGSSGIERFFERQRREGDDAARALAERQRLIDAGELSDLDSAERKATERDPVRSSMGAPESLQRDHRPSNWSTGSRSGKVKRHKPVWHCPARLSDCTNRTLCPHGKKRGRPASDDPTEKSPRTLLLDPRFYALIENSRKLSKKDSPKIRVSDFLRFWLDIHRSQILNPSAQDPMEWRGMVQHWHEDRERNPGERGAPYKWGEIQAVELDERIPVSVIEELKARGVDVDRGRKRNRTLSIDDVALIAFELFITLRIALLSADGLASSVELEPIEFDDDATSVTELKIVAERARAWREPAT
jgi:hypothetical protein